jgi:hypothetical protein
MSYLGIGVARLFAVMSLFVFGLAFCRAQDPGSATPAGTAAGIVAPPQVRINEAISDTASVRIPQSRHPLAVPANDRGRVHANLPINRILLLLKRSPEQEAALRKLLDAQHDAESPSFQHWLTPEEFATQFGPAPEDLRQVHAWLENHGFQVNRIARGQQWIEFSGAAAQVESAFHTEIHHYEVNGRQHVANAQEISLPEALLPVVRGVLSLHNFPRKPLIGKLTHIRRDPATGEFRRAVQLNPGNPASPEFTLSNENGTFHFLSPGDWSRIYNTAPLLAEGIDGSDVSIAVVGSDSDVQLSDIRTFRQIFKLPAKDPVFIVDGIDPGVQPLSAAEEEASLDIEWAGAIAPNATIKFVTAASTASTAGFDLAIARIVDDRLAPIMTTSIGACELFLGADGNAFLNDIYRQAAAEGISVIAASGDTGAAGCDPQVSLQPASFGPAVNGAASTPYNVAVGGTMFTENGLDGIYWNANNRKDLSSAVGYIPEAVWNETCDPTIDPNQCFGSGDFILDAGSGGASNCLSSTIDPILLTFTCNGGYPKPSWQVGLGVPADGARDIPDISLAAAGGHDGYLLCVEGSCQYSIVNGKTVLNNAAVVGGTSAGAPSFAGVMALLEQKRHAFQGLLNFKLYQLAQSDDLSACNSSNQTNPAQQPSCVFHDITSGNNDVPGQPGAPATPGFDLATGLGSLNVAELVERWSSVRKLGTHTDLSINEKQTVPHGHPIPINVVVAPNHGSGVPSGDFSLITGKDSVIGGTLANGSFSGAVKDLPAGDYLVRARYSGDAMFNSSESQPAHVRIFPEPSTISVVPWQLNLSGSPVPINSPVPYGQPVGLQMDVRGNSGVGSASGSVTVTVDGTRVLGPYTLNAAGNAFVWLYNLPPKGLLPGTHTFSVQYSGDSSFFAVSAKPVSIVVTKDAVIGTLVIPIAQNPDPNGAPAFTAGVPVDFVITVQGFEEPLFATLLPTGTVQLFECFGPSGFRCEQPSPIGGPIPLSLNGPVGPGIAQATFRRSFSAGAHLLAASYSGDSDFFTVQPVGISAIATPIQVGPADQLSVNFKATSGSALELGQAANYIATLKPSKPNAPLPTGSLTLAHLVDAFGTPGAISTVPLVQGNASFTVPWFAAGQQVVWAIYSGDANYAPLATTTVTTIVKPGHDAVSLRSDHSDVRRGALLHLTTLVSVSNPDPHIHSPGFDDGQIQYWDSVDGAAPRLLTTAPQFLTIGNGNTSINILPISLSLGTHAIIVNFPGTQNWLPARSNTIIVTVRDADSDE